LSARFLRLAVRPADDVARLIDAMRGYEADTEVDAGGYDDGYDDARDADSYGAHARRSGEREMGSVLMHPTSHGAWGGSRSMRRIAMAR
jgi:hypothetical protein